MSRAADAQETIQSTIERQIELGKMKIDEARARIQQSQADMAAIREAIEREEAMILEWRQLLDGMEKPQ